MVKRFIKYAFILVVLSAASFFGAMKYYYAKSYLPLRDNIPDIIKSATNEEQNLSTPAKRLLLNSIDNQSCLMSARALIYKLDVHHPVEGIHGQHFSMLYWSIFVCQEFTEDQRLTLVAMNWPYFSQLNAQGLSVAANYLYQLPLSELSIEQMAHVVACNKGEFTCINEKRRTAVAEKLLEHYYENYTL